MIKLSKEHKHKKRSDSDWRKIIIGYAKKSYELNGRLFLGDVRRLVGRKLGDLYDGHSELLIDADLPQDAVFGSTDCEYCGIRFVKGNAKSKYCCVDHQHKSLTRKRQGFLGVKGESSKCKHCGSSFDISDRLKSYCSDKCKNKEMSRRGNKKRRAAKSGGLSIPYTDIEVIKRDGTNCAHCGVETSTDCSVVADNRLNIDHIIPLSRGGHDTIYNCQVLCRRCNMRKGYKISSKDYSKAMDLWPTEVELKSLTEMERPKKNNRSGHRGVFYDSNIDRWFSQVEKSGSRVRISSHSKESAIVIRKLMKKLLDKGVDLSDIKSEAIKCRNTKNQQP